MAGRLSGMSSKLKNVPQSRLGEIMIKFGYNSIFNANIDANGNAPG